MQAVIMLPPEGDSPAEQWVAAGRSACAQDLAQRLLSIETIERVIAIVAEQADHDLLAPLGVEARLSAPGTFSFGEVLANLIEAEDVRELAYFGGASAPLLETERLQLMIERVQATQAPFAIANNLHSTDWLLINQADYILAHSHRFPTDNPLGWVLSREAGIKVDGTDPCAATRLDIDTPTDLFMAWRHPAAGYALRSFLADINPDIQSKMMAIKSVLETPASTLAIIGRASAHAWQTLVASTQIWVRLFVEERGMVASHRLAKGEVRSLIGQMLELLGADEFTQRLTGLADAVLWDTRVWMGTMIEWPSDADRFAADLGWVDSVEDQNLRDLTRAIAASSVPILAGGYGVVGGGLYALLESLPLGD